MLLMSVQTSHNLQLIGRSLMRTLAMAQNVTLDGSIEKPANWLDNRQSPRNTITPARRATSRGDRWFSGVFFLND